MIQSLGMLKESLERMRQEDVPKDLCRRIQDLIGRVQTWERGPHSYKTDGLTVAIQVGASKEHVFMQTDRAPLPPPKGIHVATQHHDCEKQQMRKTIEELTARLAKAQAQFNREIEAEKEASQNKDRTIAALRLEIQTVSSELSKRAVTEDSGVQLARFRAQVEQLQLQTEKLKAEVKALRNKKSATREERPPLLVQTVGMSQKEVASLKRQTVIDALRLGSLPRDFLLDVAEIERLSQEIEADAALWRRWWALIASKVNGLKSTDVWDEKWSPCIRRFAEVAFQYQPRKSKQITYIMGVFWKGEETLSLPRKEVEALFLEFPTIAAALWFQDGLKPPFTIYEEVCANVLTFIPLMVYASVDSPMAGYTLEVLVSKSMQAQNMGVCLYYLHMIAERLRKKPEIDEAVKKYPAAQRMWEEITQSNKMIPVEIWEQIMRAGVASLSLK